MNFAERIFVDLPNKRAETKFYVAADAEYFADHFPGAPVLPGLVMLEIAAQTAAAWLSEKEKSAANFDLNALENFYLTRRVAPNEVLFVEVVAAEIAADGKSGWFDAQANVAGEKAMRAKFRLSSD